jgi:uncharacterized iron-regulated membrane protein
MKFRQVIFWSHLVIGICIGIVVLNMSVTGIILAFRPQIEAFGDREVRRITPPNSSATRLDMNPLLAKVREHYPETPATSITVHADPTLSVAVNLGREKGTVYLHSYTGEILGSESKTHQFLQSVQDWHRWFGVQKIGKPITGAASIGFLVLIISGFYLWWPRERNSFAAVAFFNKNLRGKARDWNWHNVIGFWCSPLLLIATLTGITMSYQWANRLLYKMTGNEAPPRAERNENDAKKRKPEWISVDLNSFLILAQEKIPHWETMIVRLPQKTGAPLNISILESASAGPKPRSQLTLNSSNGEITKWEPYSSQNAGAKLRTWIKPVHTGEAWGVIGQSLALIGALGAAVLVWTGFALAWRRFLGRKQNLTLEPSITSSK